MAKVLQEIVKNMWDKINFSDQYSINKRTTTIGFMQANPNEGKIKIINILKGNKFSVTQSPLISEKRVSGTTPTKLSNKVFSFTGEIENTLQ